MSDTYLLVDGFNLYHSTHQDSPSQKPYFTDLPTFVSLIEEVAVFKGYKPVIVFDGSRFHEILTSSAAGEVVCTKPPESADDYIEARIETLRNHARFVVVTDDRVLGGMSIGYGGRWISCHSWNSEVKHYKEAASSAEKAARRKPGRFNTPFSDYFD